MASDRLIPSAAGGIKSNADWRLGKHGRIDHAGYNDQEGGGGYLSSGRNGPALSRRWQARFNAPMGARIWSLVAFSDKEELARVRMSFLKKKLGLTDPDAEFDKAIMAIGEKMKDDRTKNRVTVGKLSAFS
jgi:hypothetical protein